MKEKVNITVADTNRFIALADTIRQANRFNPGTFSEDAIRDLASFCKEQNWRFDHERWLGYIAGECGPSA